MNSNIFMAKVIFTWFVFDNRWKAYPVIYQESVIVPVVPDAGNFAADG
jgi:hypothetical protein